MKLYKSVFFFFLYESILVFIFGKTLSVFDDPLSNILIFISVPSFGFALILGIIGYYSGLFKEEEPNQDF